MTSILLFVVAKMKLSLFIVALFTVLLIVKATEEEEFVNEIQEIVERDMDDAAELSKSKRAQRGTWRSWTNRKPRRTKIK